MQDAAEPPEDVDDVYAAIPCNAFSFLLFVSALSLPKPFFASFNLLCECLVAVSSLRSLVFLVSTNCVAFRCQPSPPRRFMFAGRSLVYLIEEGTWRCILVSFQFVALFGRGCVEIAFGRNPSSQAPI